MKYTSQNTPIFTQALFVKFQSISGYAYQIASYTHNNVYNNTHLSVYVLYTYPQCYQLCTHVHSLLQYINCCLITSTNCWVHVQDLLDSGWKPMSPTEDQVDSMMTAMATYHVSDHHHRGHVRTLPAFILPGTVEDEEQEEEESALIAAVLPTHTAIQGWESSKELMPKRDAKIFQTNYSLTPLPTGQQ